jgi:hypothetical protein
MNSFLVSVGGGFATTTRFDEEDLLCFLFLFFFSEGDEDDADWAAKRQRRGVNAEEDARMLTPSSSSALVRLRARTRDKVTCCVRV